MEIEKTDFAGGKFCDGLTCSEHCSKAEFLIRLDGCIIEACQECIDDLYKELAKHVSPEVKEKTA